MKNKFYILEVTENKNKNTGLGMLWIWSGDQETLLDLTGPGRVSLIFDQDTYKSVKDSIKQGGL